LSEVPLAIADVVAQVANPSGASETVELLPTLPTGATVLFETPPLSGQHPPAWVDTLPPGAGQSFDLGVRLPNAAGTETVAMALEVEQGHAFVPVSTTSATYTVATSGAGLLAAAQSAIQALPSSGFEGWQRQSALQDLQCLSTAPVWSWQADSDVDQVLNALQSVEAMPGTNTTAARAAMENLLRYQENEYSSLRGWP
jgi:hypothetical protein